ncbi:MAG: hypothetical protein ABSG41_12475 [Bryobacteraceae bacterium]
MPKVLVPKTAWPNLFQGPPVRIRYRADLRDTAGNPASAATFIRRRETILDPELKKHPRQHQRIVLHEYFHFVWVRLGNPRRAAWEGFLKAEWDARVRGEAGWSAEWRKQKLSVRDVAERSRRWREYCCESFCDTAAFVIDADTDDSEITLSPRRRRARIDWFRRNFPGSRFAI